jgi:iron complex transport system ATP-binding protein
MMLQADKLSIPKRLNDVSLNLPGAQLVCLIGPNGSGKTSLLQALAGMNGASGSVLIDGVDPRRLGPAHRPALVTFLPASRETPWPMIARDVIALGGGSGELPELELDGLLDRRMDALSTGERSRILIARAMLPRPKLLLLDEPTANLDPLWQIRLMELIRSETRCANRIALVALHDLDMAERYADRIIVMDKGGVGAEGLEGPEIARIFGIERRDGIWVPAQNRRAEVMDKATPPAE